VVAVLKNIKDAEDTEVAVAAAAATEPEPGPGGPTEDLATRHAVAGAAHGVVAGVAKQFGVPAYEEDLRRREAEVGERARLAADRESVLDLRAVCVLCTCTLSKTHTRTQH
jgi:hypothetical protein